MRRKPGPDVLTEDAVLGGRLRLQQPRRGHRVGHDAILLAAAVAARTGDHAVELGAGVGAAGLALAQRVPELRVTLVEIDPDLCDLARANATANGLADRVTVVALDVAAPNRAYAEAGLLPGSARQLLMNPPFNDPAAHRASPDAARARAHLAAGGVLVSWIATANRLLADHGRMTLIWRADGLSDVLPALKSFGGIVVLPVYPRPETAAIRVLVQATKGSRAPLQLRPGLVLQEACGRPSPVAEAILRGGAPLPMT